MYNNGKRISLDSIKSGRNGICQAVHQCTWRVYNEIIQGSGRDVLEEMAAFVKEKGDPFWYWLM